MPSIMKRNAINIFTNLFAQDFFNTMKLRPNHVISSSSKLYHVKLILSQRSFQLGTSNKVVTILSNWSANNLWFSQDFRFLALFLTMLFYEFFFLDISDLWNFRASWCDSQIDSLSKKNCVLSKFPLLFLLSFHFVLFRWTLQFKLNWRKTTYDMLTFRTKKQQHMICYVIWSKNTCYVTLHEKSISRGKVIDQWQ